MTDEPTGLDLDVAVAKVLGWSCTRCERVEGDLHCVWRNGDRTRRPYHPPLNDHWPPIRYSTDYAALPEMLAWLRKKVEEGVLERLELSLCADGTWAAGMPEVYTGADPWSRGATILEAVCRLILRIAS